MSTYDLQVSAKAVNELVCQFCTCNLTHRPHKICSQCMVTVYVSWFEPERYLLADLVPSQCSRECQVRSERFGADLPS